ncbi:MAG: hypothetical protein ABII90_11385 [Bacteroidota bacterium]
MKNTVKTTAIIRKGKIAVALLIGIIFSNLSNLCYSQVGIGTTTPDASAILELQSTDKGILIPRSDTDSIAVPSIGLLIYQITDNKFYYFNGTIWVSALGSPGTDGINGATGPTGADGIAGVAGATGPTGADGIAGTTGATGPTGADGIAGTTGATGPTGADGIAGTTGATGPTGADGIAGTTGATGPTGADGIAGAIGATGPTGADGALNAWSLTGNAGLNIATDFVGTGDNIPLAFRTNNLERMRIDPIGNVGIGTTTPDTTLHVAGAIKLVDGTQGNGKVLTSDANGLASWQTPTAGTDSVMYADNTGYADSADFAWDAVYADTADFAGNAVWDQNGDTIYYNDGNVGIGTTNPDAELEVVRENGIPSIYVTGYNAGYSPGIFMGRKANGTAASPTAVVADDALAIFGGYGYGTTGWGSSSRTRMYIKAAQDWTDSTRGSYIHFNTVQIDSITARERLRITDAGNVGIGTTSPDGNMEVVADQGVPVINVTGYRDAFSAGKFIGRKARGTEALPTAVQTDDALACFGGTGYGTSAWGTARTRMYISAAQNWTDAAHGSYIYFTTIPINSVTAIERLRITDAGNVGIGTSTPYALLHVSDTNANPVFFESSNDLGVQILLSPTAVGGKNYKLLSTADGNSFGGSKFAIYDPDNATARLVVNSTGNVGIGTTNPGTKLDIIETGDNTTTYPVRIYNDDEPIDAETGQEVALKFALNGVIGGTPGVRDAAYIIAGKDADFVSNDWADVRGNLRFYVADTGYPNEKMRIDGSGNVGIGTPSPTSKLHVTGLQVHADNAAAIAGGLTAGAFYRTASGVLMVVY